MSKQHVVKQGESIVTIAHAYDFRTGTPIWEAEANADLRARRKDPNILYPGDVVAIPDKGERTVWCATSRTHRFVLERLVRKLRLHVQDASGVALEFEPWELDVEGGASLAGETDESGLVETEIPVSATTATLRVGPVQWELELDALDPARDTADGGVSGVQQRLRNLGIDPGLIDGDPGTKTREAVAMFQATRGLPVTGELDEATVTRLEETEGC